MDIGAGILNPAIDGYEVQTIKVSLHQLNSVVVDDNGQVWLVEECLFA